MKIAVFDHKTSQSIPIGQLQLKMINALRYEHEFTVYSVEFDNPDPSRISWVRISVPTRPLALLFAMFYVQIAIVFTWSKLAGIKFDLVQRVESKMPFGEVNYAHFCHRTFLKNHWKSVNPGGIRGILRWLDHKLHALAEPAAYRGSKYIIVPSFGLKRELETEFPFTSGRIQVISNPVNLTYFHRQKEFDREANRSLYGFGPEDVVLVFIALGQFERKGLPLLLEALVAIDRSELKLLVVGGENDLLKHYRNKTSIMGLAERVKYIGKHSDIRPFLHLADAFVLPSFYEVFSLVALEAAAAGLPLLTTPLNGVEEYLQDGRNGLLMEPTIEGVTVGLQRFLALEVSERRALGDQALKDIKVYDDYYFINSWRIFYQKIENTKFENIDAIRLTEL